MRLPLNKVVPGVVPDPDETLVFWVESSSGEGHYRVDLTCYDGQGKCDCPDHRIRQRECKHIRRSARYLRFQVIYAILEEKERASSVNKQNGAIGAMGRRMLEAAA